MTTAKKLGGECAFPTKADGDPGLTKREWLAGLAMQGLLSIDATVDGKPVSMPVDGVKMAPIAAAVAVTFADALLAELAKS